jgi:hypothetical protein
MRHFRVCVAFLAAVVLAATLSGPVVASCEHDNAPPRCHDKHSLQSGAWALQFGVNYLVSLTSFQGGLISVKKHFTPRSAVRLGVSASLTTDDITSVDRTIKDDTETDNVQIDTDRNQGSLQVALQYLFYPTPAADIHTFFGVGPSVSYANTKDRPVKVTSLLEENQYYSVSGASSNSWGLGLSGLIGAEWFARRTISLHAEYGATFGYSHSSNTRDYTYIYYDKSQFDQRTEKHDAWKLSADSVKFGLSVYF